MDEKIKKATGLDAIDLVSKVQKQIELSSSMASLMHSSHKLSHLFRDISAVPLLNMSNQFSSAMKNIYNSAELAKLVSHQPKFNIPKEFFSSIDLIRNNQIQLYDSVKTLSTTFANAHNLSKFNHLQFALSGISNQLVTEISKTKKWDLIEDFEEISTAATSISEDIIANQGITQENFKELKSFLNRMELKIDSTEKKIDSSTSIWWTLVTILGLILAVLGEIRNWLPQPNYATKEEVSEIVKEHLQKFEANIKSNNKTRITNCKCNVRLKPNTSSFVITTLQPNFEVVILDIFKKWAFVSFQDSSTNLQQAGWIMKKYLTRSK